MRTLEMGDIITGTVTGIEKYGIFVNAEKYSGLVHISEISNNFVRNIHEYAKVGQKLKVKVVEVDTEKKQLKLSIKDFEDKNRSFKRHKIVETTGGFLSIANHLDLWVRDKLSEINLKK